MLTLRSVFQEEKTEFLTLKEEESSMTPYKELKDNLRLLKEEILVTYLDYVVWVRKSLWLQITYPFFWAVEPPPPPPPARAARRGWVVDNKQKKNFKDISRKRTLREKRNAEIKTTGGGGGRRPKKRDT